MDRIASPYDLIPSSAEDPRCCVVGTQGGWIGDAKCVLGPWSRHKHRSGARSRELVGADRAARLDARFVCLAAACGSSDAAPGIVLLIQAWARSRRPRRQIRRKSARRICQPEQLIILEDRRRALDGRGKSNGHPWAR
jgi:hypothetical protein